MSNIRELDLIAPAKVNLSLVVGDVKSSGRHPVETVMQSIDICDRLTIRVESNADEPGISIEMNDNTGLAGTISDIDLEDNLIYRAIVDFLVRIDAPITEKFEVVVDKRIPAGSGMGGGSSDCAATIAALAQLYGMDPKCQEALDVAAELGSDVTFFLYGGCVCMEGHGQIYKETLPTPDLNIVLARPQSGLPTAEVYRKFDDLCMRRVNEPQPLVSELSDSIREGRDLEETCTYMQNFLEDASCSLVPEVAELIDRLANSEGVIRSMLSGSGSSVFAICEDGEAAKRVSKELNEAGWWSIATKSVSFGAGVEQTSKK